MMSRVDGRDAGPIVGRICSDRMMLEP